MELFPVASLQNLTSPNFGIRENFQVFKNQKSGSYWLLTPMIAYGKESIKWQRPWRNQEGVDVFGMLNYGLMVSLNWDSKKVIHRLGLGATRDFIITSDREDLGHLKNVKSYISINILYEFGIKGRIGKSRYNINQQ